MTEPLGSQRERERDIQERDERDKDKQKVGILHGKDRKRQRLRDLEILGQKKTGNEEENDIQHK